MSEQERELGVVRIWQEDAVHLGVVWTDGKQSSFDTRLLRQLCPCAVCEADRQAGRFVVGDDVVPLRVQSVGNYAMKIVFSDGHDTGIFEYAWLHERG